MWHVVNKIIINYVLTLSTLTQSKFSNWQHCGLECIHQTRYYLDFFFLFYAAGPAGHFLVSFCVPEPDDSMFSLWQIISVTPCVYVRLSFSVTFFIQFIIYPPVKIETLPCNAHHWYVFLFPAKSVAVGILCQALS